MMILDGDMFFPGSELDELGHGNSGTVVFMYSQAEICVRYVQREYAVDFFGKILNRYSFTKGV